MASSEAVQTPRHPFYDRLNAILDQRKFDQRVEHIRRKYYKSQYRPPGTAPGVYFRPF